MAVALMTRRENIKGGEVISRMLAAEGVEVVFGYPGLGYILVNAINAGDYNVIMGVTLLSVVGIATASLLVDLSYPLFDPRVRYR